MTALASICSLYDRKEDGPGVADYWFESVEERRFSLLCRVWHLRLMPGSTSLIRSRAVNMTG